MPSASDKHHFDAMQHGHIVSPVHTQCIISRLTKDNVCRSGYFRAVMSVGGYYRDAAIYDFYRTGDNFTLARLALKEPDHLFCTNKIIIYTKL